MSCVCATLTVAVWCIVEVNRGGYGGSRCKVMSWDIELQLLQSIGENWHHLTQQQFSQKILLSCKKLFSLRRVVVNWKLLSNDVTLLWLWLTVYQYGTILLLLYYLQFYIINNNNNMWHGTFTGACDQLDLRTTAVWLLCICALYGADQSSVPREMIFHLNWKTLTSAEHSSLAVALKCALVAGTSENFVEEVLCYMNWHFDWLTTYCAARVPGGPSSRSGHRMVACQKILLIFGGFHESAK